MTDIPENVDENAPQDWQGAKENLYAIFGDESADESSDDEDVLPEKVIETPETETSEISVESAEEVEQEEPVQEDEPPKPPEVKEQPATEPVPPLVMDVQPLQPSIQQVVHEPIPQSTIVSVPTIALSTATLTPKSQADPTESTPEYVQPKEPQKEPPERAFYAPMSTMSKESPQQFMPEPVKQAKETAQSQEIPTSDMGYLPTYQYSLQAPLHEPKVGEHRHGVTLSTNLGRGWFLGCLDESGEERAVYVRNDPEWLKLGAHKLLPKVQKVGSFFVLEAMQGDPLARSLPLPKAMQFVNELARLVFALEKQGYALTDIDPENMLDTPNGLRLCLMPRVHPIGHPARSALREGYDPPELQAGVSADTRTGVYLLGALLYKWMVGKPLPVEGATPFVLRAVREPGIPQLLNKMLAPLYARLTPSVLLKELSHLSQQKLAHYIAEGATTVGLNPDRLSNEDAYGFVHLHLNAQELPVAHLRACVADGMGGMELGEVASAAAVRGFLHSTQNALVDRVWDANEAVLDIMGQRDGGCTLSGVEIIDDQLQIGHVGDCRVYVYDGQLKQLSEDHSYVAAMVANGQMTEEEARESPERNKVLRSLGQVHQPQMNYVQTLPETITLQSGHRVLIVSDGVWGEVNPVKMAKVLEEESDVKQVVTKLLQLTLDAGAPDNATAVLIERRE